MMAGWNFPRSRGYVPHCDNVGLVQHIVFRLADSLPAAKVESLDTTPTIQRLAAAEAALDRGFGARSLCDPRVAALVRDALLYFDGQRYRLSAWCVMPNHVHVLAMQVEGWPLASVIHSWKSLTANRANIVLGRQGRFWAREYFDRAMRSEEQAEKTCLYIEANPVTAGLCANPADWPWSSASDPGAPASSRQPTERRPFSSVGRTGGGPEAVS